MMEGAELTDAVTIGSVMSNATRRSQPVYNAGLLGVCVMATRQKLGHLSAPCYLVH